MIITFYSFSLISCILFLSPLCSSTSNSLSNSRNQVYGLSSSFFLVCFWHEKGFMCPWFGYVLFSRNHVCISLILLGLERENGGFTIFFFWNFPFRGRGCLGLSWALMTCFEVLELFAKATMARNIWCSRALIALENFLWHASVHMSVSQQVGTPIISNFKETSWLGL